jgi:hypothetical protein
LWHCYALLLAQSLIAIRNQIWRHKLPVDMKLQAFNCVSYQTLQHWCLEDSVLRECDAVSLGEWFLTFQSWPSTVFVCDCMTYDDGGTMILWNAGNHSPNGTAPYPRSLDSSTTSLWDPQISWWQTVLRHFFLTYMKLIPHTTVHLSSSLRTNNAIK